MDKNQADRGTRMAMAVHAKALRQNPLLTQILEQRKKDLIQQWQGCGSIEGREEAWQALRQLDVLAGAIEDAIKRAIEQQPGRES